jgi:hypothetical protein
LQIRKEGHQWVRAHPNHRRNVTSGPAGIAGDERYKIGLTPCTGLFEDVVQVAFDGLFRDAEHRGNFG